VTIVYPVNAEVKAGAMLSLSANSRVINEGFRVGTKHLIRRNAHIVQDRPLRSVRWADTPEVAGV
jgi:hypothetical protein